MSEHPLCFKCQSDKILIINAKCNDMCQIDYKNHDYDGGVPNNLNIGGGDYIGINLCINCGTVQGEWPLHDDIIEELEENGPDDCDDPDDNDETPAYYVQDGGYWT